MQGSFGDRKRLHEMIPASGGRLGGGQGPVLEYRVSDPEPSEEWEEQTEPREQQARPSRNRDNVDDRALLRVT